MIYGDNNSQVFIPAANWHKIEKANITGKQPSRNKNTPLAVSQLYTDEDGKNYIILGGMYCPFGLNNRPLWSAYRVIPSIAYSGKTFVNTKHSKDKQSFSGRFVLFRKKLMVCTEKTDLLLALPEDIFLSLEDAKRYEDETHYGAWRSSYEETPLWQSYKGHPVASYIGKDSMAGELMNMLIWSDGNKTHYLCLHQELDLESIDSLFSDRNHVNKNKKAFKQQDLFT